MGSIWGSRVGPKLLEQGKCGKEERGKGEHGKESGKRSSTEREPSAEKRARKMGEGKRRGGKDCVE